WDKWAKPINDFLACSSVVGSLNAMDIPFGASYYGKMAYRLSGEPIPERWKNILSDKIDSCHFEYPNSTHAIRGRVEGDFHIRNTDEEAHTGERALKISANGSFPGGESYFFKKTYYLPEDFHDSRYDPSMSPLVYPGQTLHLSVLPERKETDINGYVQTYVRNGATKEIIRGERVSVTERQWMELSMKFPPI
ncbi:MAG: ADP-ribosylglycohydrolase family protein, partial [Oscillospiraceae bacterium]